MGDDDDGVIGWIREIVLDSPDPWALAAFWAGLLGGAPVQWYPGWVTLEPPPHGQRLSFQGSTAGDDPAGSTPAAAGVHFDVLVSDLTAAHDRVVASGGTFTAEHISQTAGRSMAVHPDAAAVEQDRPADAGADRAVDSPPSRWRERDEDDLGALAAHAQHPVAVLFAEVGNVSPGGFEDPQAEQAEHGHQCEVGRIR